MRRPVVFGLLGVLFVGAVVVAMTVRGGEDGGYAGPTVVNGLVNQPSCKVHRSAARSAICPTSTSFSPKPYIIHGDSYDCLEFATQADAQAVLKADPSDPNHLDPEHTGVACREIARGGATDLAPIASIAAKAKCTRASTRTARCPQRSRSFDPQKYLSSPADVYDCDVFASQADAQAVLRFSPTDPNDLDSDGNGIACPQLRPPKDVKQVERPL